MRKTFLTSTLVLVSLAALATAAHAGDKKSLCIFDPSGAHGDIFQMLQDYRVAASQWGVDFDTKPYTDEKTAAEDFKAGKCDAVAMTGVRTRTLHKFAGTLEAMGGMPSYKDFHAVVKTLAKPAAAKLAKSGQYELVGLFPAGAVYLYSADKSIDNTSKLAGKRIATIDFDTAAKVMVRHVGASMVAADIGTFSGMFNNHSVDLCYAPATAYKALELYKGLGSKGAIIEYPLAQVTIQILVREGTMPEGFGQESRKWAAKNFNEALKHITKLEKSIPAKHWLDVSPEAKAAYDDMFREVRIRLRDKEKVYDKTALSLMRRVRCMRDGTRAECAEKRE